MTQTETALMEHLIAQMQANVTFLQTHGYLNPSDAADINNKLSSARADGALAPAMRNMGISPPQPMPQIPMPGRYQSPPHSPAYPPAQSTPYSQPQSTPYSPPQSPPYNQPSQSSPYGQPQNQWQPPSGPPTPSYQGGPPVTRGKALWAYNEDGREPNDLSFGAGETIEITEETNPDWWTGRARGRTGLFPSTYVEKIQDNNAAPNARAYKPFGAAYHGSDAYPPPMNNAMGGQVVEVNPNQNAVVVQQDVAGQEKKKNKFGKYGNTIAQSAAGGLGFGAGAAVGGGIINSIF